MALNGPIALRRSLGFIGTHTALLAGAIGLLFLQRYIWLLGIAQRGFGPYQTFSYLTSLSMIMVLIDLPFILWGLKGTRTERAASVFLPALFIGGAALILVVNNI